MKWLILRGLVREQRHWGDFKKQFENDLKKNDPDAQIFALDFPGFGTEAHRYSPSTIAEIVTDLRSRWKKLAEADPSSEWGLFAMSLGGMVSLDWCSRYPNDFKKLVLVNSSVNGLSPIHHRMKPKNYPKLFSMLLKDEIAKREKQILEMTTNLQGADLEMRAKDYASFALEVRKRDAIFQLIAAIRFRPPQKVTTPMLILRSLGDELVAPSCSQAIANFYQAPMFTHPAANHDLPTDAPAWIGEQVNAWLSSNKPSVK